MWAAEQERGGSIYLASAYATGTAHLEKFHVVTGQEGAFTYATPAVLQAASPNTDHPFVLAYINGSHRWNPPSNGTYAETCYARSDHDKQYYLKSDDWSTYQMDFAKPAWIEQVIADSEEAIANGMNGVFLDTMGPDPVQNGRTECYANGTATPWGESNPSGGTAYNWSTHTAYTVSEWLHASRHLIMRVREALRPSSGPEPIVMANGLVRGYHYFTTGTDQLFDASPYACAEGYLHDGWASITAWPSETRWQEEVNMLLDATSRGGVVFTLTKMWVTNPSQADLDKWHRFTLAAFLLGADGHHCMLWSANEANDAANNYPEKRTALDHNKCYVWDTDWDMSIGYPTDVLNYPTEDVTDYKITHSPGYYYRRAFENGLVLTNPTTTALTNISLGGNYTRASSKMVPSETPSGTITTIDLGSRESAILLKA